MLDEEKRGHGILLDLAVEEVGSPGIVVNADIAARTGCRCYVVDGIQMCFSRGIVGTLSKPQVEAYCPTKELLTEGGLVERVKAFKTAAKEAHKKVESLPKGERLETWLREMGKELKKRGIEI